MSTSHHHPLIRLGATAAENPVSRADVTRLGVLRRVVIWVRRARVGEVIVHEGDALGMLRLLFPLVSDELLELTLEHARDEAKS